MTIKGYWGGKGQFFAASHYGVSAPQRYMGKYRLVDNNNVYKLVATSIYETEYLSEYVHKLEQSSGKDIIVREIDNPYSTSDDTDYTVFGVFQLEHEITKHSLKASRAMRKGAARARNKSTSTTRTMGGLR